MSDLCNEQDIGDNIYTNTYSLWGNSKYYDIKNLSPQNFANRNGTIGSEIGQEFRATRWVPSKPEVEVKKDPPDPFKRRTITKESLYQDPDKNNKINSNFDWTLGYWDKAAEQPEQDGGQGSSRGKKQVLGGAKIQKKLDKMLAKPVKMTKAESQLSLFKKAPDHVFLIVPQDLKKTKEGKTEDKPIEVDCKEDIVPETSEDQKDQNRQMDQEPEELEPEETNPFLISITRNLKKNTDSEMKEEVEIAEIPENPVVPEAEKIPEEPVNPEMSDEVMKLILEYYKKFKGNRRYSQFKFLGPFDEEEIVCINEFIQQAMRYLNKEPSPYASVFDDVEFEINEDCTGNTV
ncbi:hypothetical protein HF086_009191 [Spodoptera exigua]|uniref:Uncharacterized protein n=1 Tax=Spodoptera exigua TaxID=7107 RepID=A0A922SIF7_SPOEX|nr:hypothetical protein HF086_009191 [Spodoptera exigua]